ncbi:ribose 5-phosphate isomerase B [Mariniplasma anaerobium]|uniref:Ribose 5-phosphate isomerase B n=1 Tax=Mariniplasma anaerobium TaxID=2735436 RepID=A0A7U9TL78_9MOLU|nr:ribose 5-phosphate isomerase B [Mariniplasma anaerobium]BCR35438.1 ribose 5-phosphate isomerase B [Mariniplasma anaerobium]
MKLAIGSDHGGYELKEYLKSYFDKNHIDYDDFGTNSNESVDYPDYGKKVALAVLAKPYDFGIVICGTGIGISIAANKVKGIRAALVYDELTARLAKEHNRANIIALGGRTTKKEDAVKIVNAFMNATYEPRHQKRIDKIKDIEESYDE